MKSEEKRQERAQAFVRRASAYERHRATAGDDLARHGLAFLSVPSDCVVSGFSAIRDEIDPTPLLARLAAEGHGLALPVLQGKGRPLVFRNWTPGDRLAAGQWGIAEPLPDQPEVYPDVLLVPLLAFDDHGYRLGYGGGFYDRSLAGLRSRKPIIAVGIGYDEQRIDAVPHLDYDQRLDWVLTPSGPIRCSGS
jgi:5-formyltetrahydrofolate cyclo-ligase